jgi:hypothetical protein
VDELYVVCREEEVLVEEGGHAAAVVAFACDAVSTKPINAICSECT